MQPGTLIPPSKPQSAGALLSALGDCQRQRLTDRLAALTHQGVEPGDAWQVAASHQRQADLPRYELTASEQEAMDRIARTLSGERPEPESVSDPRRSLPGLGVSDAETDGTAEGGAPLKDEPLADEQSQSDQAIPVAVEPPPVVQGWGSRNQSNPAPISDSDADAQTDLAQSILDNARQVIDHAIASGAVADAEGTLRAENLTHAATLGPDGVMRVENRQTGGIAIGDETGIREAKGLTGSDQQAWRSFRQLSDAERQQEQAQRAPERQHRSDLEL